MAGHQHRETLPELLLRRQSWEQEAEKQPAQNKCLIQRLLPGGPGNTTIPEESVLEKDIVGIAPRRQKHKISSSCSCLRHYLWTKHFSALSRAMTVRTDVWDVRTEPKKVILPFHSSCYHQEFSSSLIWGDETRKNYVGVVFKGLNIYPPLHLHHENLPGTQPCIHRGLHAMEAEQCLHTSTSVS